MRVSKLMHSKGICCLLYYDTLSTFLNWTESAYVIMIFRMPTLLRYPQYSIFECLHYSYTKTACIIMIPSLPTSLWYLWKDIIIAQANMPTLLWYPYCLYYYYILTRFKILVPVLLWYSECLSYSYIHSAYLIMIFIKNSQKKLICAFFITIYRVPALLLYVECLLYYNLPLF